MVEAFWASPRASLWLFPEVDLARITMIKEIGNFNSYPHRLLQIC